MAWKQTLLAASFKGVGFEVSDDSLSARHALSNHAYPYVVGADIDLSTSSRGGSRPLWRAPEAAPVAAFYCWHSRP